MRAFFQTTLKLSLVLLLCTSMDVVSGATTRHLKDIFLGRCYDYNLTISDKPLPGVTTECPVLWDMFQSVFAYKPTCGVNYTSYFPYLEATRQDIPENTSLFWSGTRGLSHQLSLKGRNYVTLEDTLIGFLANALNWCGQEAAPGIDYVSCPERATCPHNANSAFWEASSTVFSQEASGLVYVLLDGSNPDRPAYRRSSFFGRVELPNLDTAKVTGVQVMLTHRLGKPEIETCTTGSLVDLKEDVEARNLEFRCERNPEPVLHLMCSDDPSHSECHTHVFSGCPFIDRNGSSNIQYGCMSWFAVIVLACLTTYLHTGI